MTKIINSFPGYKYDYGKNMYRGIDVGMGGYVYAEPGIYTDVALLDVASMHPHSILAMNCFGEYTQNYKNLIDIRIAIKHKDFDTVRNMFDGKLAKYLDNEESADMLSKALKLPINGTYGLTAAKFDNPFRDSRNKNNIVALRGALFMKTLQDEVVSRGFTVCHIKTDSIKIPNATPEIIEFCMEFGKKYGYTFEHEATYEKMCLVNDAVYIAKYKDGKHAGEWTATGAQFAVPYVFKTLFSKEPIEFEDLCETKSVKSAIYLDMNETLPDVTAEEKELDKYETHFKKQKITEEEWNDIRNRLNPIIESGHDYRFVGKVGNFCPVLPGHGGGLLVRDQNGKMYNVAGSTGYRWMESELVRGMNEDCIDRSYYNALVDGAVDTISQYGDFEWFVSEDK